VSFTPLTRDALGWYVYLLCDPRDGQAFYVGKGRGDRAFAHARDALDVADHPELQTAKHDRILDIQAAAMEPTVLILRHAIKSPEQAYEIESAAIDLVNRFQPGLLLNVVLGHHHAQHGLMSAEEVETLYAAQPAPEPECVLLLVSLNHQWTPTITAADLRKYTTGWWRAGGVQRRQPKYILGVHNGVVRSAYRVRSWRLRAEGDWSWTPQDEIDRNRWGFEVADAPEMSAWIRTSVKRYLTARQWSIRYVEPGSASPLTTMELPGGAR
jgi:hypothetical protein